MAKILDIWKIPNYCQKNPAPKLSETWKQTDIPWAIFYHIGRNWDTLQFFTNYWNIFPSHHLPTIVFTYHDDQEQNIVDENMKFIDEQKHKVRDIKWIKVPNRGVDIYPFFHAFDALGDLSKKYVLILKLHAKKSNQEWIETLVQDCLPSTDWIDWFLNVSVLRDDVGIICSTTENLDWINTPLLFDYWIRGGIIPRPIYKSDKIPRYKEILHAYKEDSEKDSFIKEPTQIKRCLMRQK